MKCPDCGEDHSTHQGVIMGELTPYMMLCLWSHGLDISHFDRHLPSGKDETFILARPGGMLVTSYVRPGRN